MNLFQAYDNILQVVYSQPRQGQVGGKVKSLLEICARDIGWEIEMNVREWLAEEEELEEDGMGEMERQINRDITRRRSHHHLSLNESLSESDDDEPSTSRRTSSSSTVTRCSTNVEEMTKGELELESSRLQDEAYESCPSHTYRWILAEHATSIVHDELSKMSEELPYEFVEIWFDWCLSYGATSEASRFHSLLISTSLAPLSSSRRSLTTTTSSIPHLLLKSPNPLSLLEQLESYLSTSTFQDRLFFHHNLVIPASLPPTPTLLSSSSSTLIGGAGGKEEWKDQMGRIRGYLEIMLKLAESMIKSYLQVYTSGNPHYLHHRDREGKGGLKKDTKEIFERILKLLGAITGETALRNLTDLSMGNSSRWKGKKRAMDRTQGGGILASLARMRGNREGELEAELKGLWEVSKEVETVVAEIDLLDSSESEKEEEEERNVPTISEQLGSIVGFLDLADLVHSTTSRPLAKSFDNDLSLSVPLLSHYISTHLLPIIPPASLLLATDSTRQCTISTTSRQVKRAVLMSLRTSRESGGQLDLTEELEQEIEKRWRALEAESRENGRPQLSSRVSREEDQAREFRRKRPSPKNQRPYPRLLPSLQCSSDSDVDDLDTISPPPPFVTSRPLSRLPLDRPSSLLQPRPSNRPITTASSEPDELALLPPPRRLLPTSLTHRRKSSSSPQKQKRKRSRIAVQLPLSPSPDAPSEPTYDDNSSEERSISPRTVSPPWKERPAAKKLERLEEQDPAPLKKRRLESHVRTHSAPQKLLRDLDVMSRGVGPENDVEEEEEDELMMSF
ncbi:uncharacterized protein JCM6883_005381 [Sporobolomyces salmoneus]|uniref:uncharacterized protein n=1 Tax=Sporobolomyces salmoneus TaxID=183962 RepID=UPI0031772DC3